MHMHLVALLTLACTVSGAAAASFTDFIKAANHLQLSESAKFEISFWQAHTSLCQITLVNR